MSKECITLVVNDKTYEVEVEPRELLSDVLRDKLGLTGTHVGCEHGVCGSCTVFINGKSARTCLAFAAQCDGFEITTIEGLGTVNEMHPVQQAFWDKHGLQCGFCTPGMMIAAIDLLNENPNPDREDIVEAVSGNLCRCTGYQTIIEAVEQAAEHMRKERG